MANKKRTRDGQVKPAFAQETNATTDQDISMTDLPPPKAQNTRVPVPVSKPQDTQKKTKSSNSEGENNTTQSATAPKQNLKPRNERHSKLPQLPKNTHISRRPLLHPPIPTPYTSSRAPKIIYIQHSTPFIPAIKRIRKLLSLASHRDKQSSAAQSNLRNRRNNIKGPLHANGRLSEKDVEKCISDDAQKSAEKSSGKDVKEKVYLKASGRAIPRALEIGVWFQEESDCEVRVEMGSVKVIDDIEVLDEPETGREDQEGQVEVGAKQVEEDIPETRIRTISSVTVSVWLK